MAPLITIAERRTRIDRYLETAFKRANDRSLARGTSTVYRLPDRWGGWLATLSENSVTDKSVTDAVLSASAAVELLQSFVIAHFGQDNGFLTYKDNI